MKIELTSVEAVIVKMAVIDRINLYKKTGLDMPDIDQKELDSILFKLEKGLREVV